MTNVVVSSGAKVGGFSVCGSSVGVASVIGFAVIGSSVPGSIVFGTPVSETSAVLRFKVVVSAGQSVEAIGSPVAADSVGS